MTSTKDSSASTQGKPKSANDYIKQIDRLLKFHFDWDGIDDISLILPEFLWLGNQEDAEDIQQLNNLGINFVLNCAGTDIEDIEYPDNFQVLNIEAEDDDDCDMRLHFENCFKFINKCKEEKGKILIHCVAGMNRSPTVTVAYLMHSCDMHLLQAVEYTVSKRGWILGNDAFKSQLVSYAGKREKLCEYDWKKNVNSKSQKNENVNKNTNNT